MSNYLDIDGQARSKVGPTMEISSRKPKTPDIRVVGEAASVLRGERQRLVDLVTSARDPLTVQRALAEINVSAAQRGRTISLECVTGHLLPTGQAEICPHGIADDVEYLPGFVRAEMERGGIRGFVCKTGVDGNPLPPRWVGMTAKVQGVVGDRIVGIVHVVRNIASPIGGAPSEERTQTFWKVLGKNEPRTVTFKIQKQ